MGNYLKVNVLSIILISILSSCSKNINTSLYQEGLNGKVKSVVVNTISAKLDGDKWIEDKPSGYKNYVFNYNKQGYEINSCCFSPKGDIIYIDNYSYNDTIKTVVRKNIAKMLLRIESFKRISADSSFVNFYGPGKELLSSSSIYYKKGRVFKEVETITGDSIVKNTISYSYNKKNLVSKVVSDIHGNITREETYKIEAFDSHNNWIKRLQTIVENGNKKLEICKRGIEYYE